MRLKSSVIGRKISTITTLSTHHALYNVGVYADVNIINLLPRKGATVVARALWKALKRGLDEEVIGKLLESITLTDTIERSISTALSRSCINGRLDLLKVLLDAGASINMSMYSGETALYVAASRGLSRIFELFLDSAYPVRQGDCTPDAFNPDTSLTGLTGCANVIHLLLMKHADAKRLLSKALSFSSSPGSRDAAKLLFETCEAYHKAFLSERS